MKFTLYGKVVKRFYSKQTWKNGSVHDVYKMEIEEPYTGTIDPSRPAPKPNTFVVQSELASAFGKPDGVFGVGKWVTANGFVSGYKYTVNGRDSGKPEDRFGMTLRLCSLETAKPPAAASGAAASQPATPAADGVADDIPF